MNLTHLDFLIYSSHKTSTQSLLTTLCNNKYKAIHCHSLKDLQYYTNINANITKENFIQALIDHKHINKQKLKIISIIRNPNDRLISSFFQSFSTDEIQLQKKNTKDTTISLNDDNELCMLYEKSIKNNLIPGQTESLDELSDIFRINIIQNLIKKKDYYYIYHELFELFVLDFNKLIDVNSHIYVNNILSINLKNITMKNLSDNKDYYHKYKNVKKMLGTSLNELIEQKYNIFYFTAFS